MAYADLHMWVDVQRDFNSNLSQIDLFAPGQTVQIHKIGVTLESSQTGTTSIVAKKRTGTSTDTTIATIVTLASSPGKFIYKESAAPLATLSPGDRVTFESTKSGTASLGQLVIMYSFLDEALGDSNEVATA